MSKGLLSEKTILGFLLSLCAISCSSLQTFNDSYSTVPELLEQAPLPTLPRTIFTDEWNLKTLMLIGADGAVLAVRLENSSGDPEWDSLAVQRLKLWKFSPATMSGTPVRVWIRQKILVKVETPHILALAEIVVNDKALADSLYAVLSNSGSIQSQRDFQFDTLVSLFSVSPSRGQRGNIGERDIHRYPASVRPYLERLKIGECTPPLKISGKFVIFKRVAAENQFQ
ncbi:MAG: TonB family protein [Bacteroidota bacterium]|nr:TonB family protein [Bacteroidota bacterium]